MTINSLSVVYPAGPGIFFVERVTRIELALSAWEADVLPLNYTRAQDTGASCRPAARPDIVPKFRSWGIDRMAVA